MTLIAKFVAVAAFCAEAIRFWACSGPNKSGVCPCGSHYLDEINHGPGH